MRSNIKTQFQPSGLKDSCFFNYGWITTTAIHSIHSLLLASVFASLLSYKQTTLRSQNMFSRDKSERFKSALPSPGPGEFDAAHPSEVGFRSTNLSFRGSGRFSENDDVDESGRLSGMSMSPRRRIPSRPNSRTTDWTANRIKDLETELRISKAKISELQQVIRESGMTPDKKEELEEELSDLKNKLLTQRGATAQAQREAAKAQSERKKIETELANASMRAKKADESRKIAEAKVSEAKFKATDLEKQLVAMEGEMVSGEERHLNEIQLLKKKLSEAQSISQSSGQQDQVHAHMAQLQSLSHFQQEQLASMEEELSASKAAAEKLISENLAQILVTRAELTVASEREAESDAFAKTLKDEIQKLKAQCDSALSEKADLESELERLKLNNAAKTDSLERLHEELELALEELRKRDQRVQEFEKTLQSMKDDQSTKSDSLNQAEIVMNDLRSDLELKNEEVRMLVSRVMDMTIALGGEFTPDEEADLGMKLEKFTQVVSDNRVKITELEKLTEGQESELKHLANKVATVLKEKKAKVGELERQKKEEKSLRRSLAEQEGSINDLTSKLEAADIQSQEEAEMRTNLETELQAVRQQLGEKTDEAAEKLKDVDAKDQQLIDVQAELDRTKEALDQQHDVVKGLQEQVQQLDINIGERGSSVSGLEDKMRSLGSEKSNLQSALANLKKELSQSKADAKKKDDTVSGLKKEISKLENRLSKATETKKKAEESLDQMTKQKTEADEKLKQSKSAYKQSQSIVSSQKEELARLKTEKRQVETQLDASHASTEKSSGNVAKKLAEAHEALKRRDEEIRQLQTEMDQNLRSNDAVKHDQSKVQHRLVKAENEARLKTTQLHDLQTQLDAIKKQNADLIREKDQSSTFAKARLAEREKRLQRLEKELAQLKERMGEMTVDTNVDRGTENELRNLLKEQRKQYESQIRSLKLEPTSIKELRSEVSAANAVATSTRKQNEALKEQLREVRDRLAFFEGTNPTHDEELDEIDRLKEALREAERKVKAAQDLALQYQHQLRQSETLKLEMERLEEENMHLHSRSAQLSADMTGLMTSGGTGLGHHNARQKIQYHLKLKTELEELRKQYTVLSREKFKLEQAIRYMAARADLISGHPTADVTGVGIRPPTATMAPPSTRESVVLSTPTAKTHMKWASRGRGTHKNMSAYKSRDKMERGIEETQIATVVERQALKRDVSEAVAGSSDPVILPLAAEDLVETRILSTISTVVSSRRRRHAEP